MTEVILRHLPALIIALPLVIAPLLALAPTRDSWRSICWLSGYIVSGLVFAGCLFIFSLVLKNGAVVYFMGDWPPPIGIEYKATRLNSFILLIISSVNFILFSFAFHNVEREIPRQRIPLFYACMMLCVSGLLGMVITNDIFNVYVFLEIASITSYAMVSLGKTRKALSASFNYLVIGTLGGTFFLFGVGLLFAATGTLNISDIAGAIANEGNSKVIAASAIFIITGLCIKASVFPFSLWLPRVYTYAPSYVSSLFAAISTKVPLYLLVRSVYEIYGAGFLFSQLHLDKVLLLLSAAGIIYGSVAACFQQDIRRAFAFSSIANIGYIVLGFSIANSEAITSSLTLFVAHAFAKGGLFVFAGIVAMHYGSTRLADFAGMGKTAPMLSAAFTILCLSLMGTPLTAGFLSKWYLVSGALSGGDFATIIALPAIAIGTLCAVLYLFRVIEMIYFHSPAERKDKDEVIYNGVPVYIYAVVLLYIGIYPAPMMKLFSEIAGGLGL